MESEQIEAVAERLEKKGLFGKPGDTLSVREPGKDRMQLHASSDLRSECIVFGEAVGTAAKHAVVYQQRGDVGAVLLTRSPWAKATGSLDHAFPTLFDEQARHIGPVPAPLDFDDLPQLAKSIALGGNLLLGEDSFMHLGMSIERVTFNAELFSKCAQAYLLARSTKQRVKTIPRWVCYIAGGRLKKDQRVASESYARGERPENVKKY